VPDVVLPDIEHDVETDEEGVNSAPSSIEDKIVVNVETAVETLMEKMEKEEETVVEVVTKNVAPKMTEDLFTTAKEKNKDITVAVTNESNQLMYSWTFNAKDIDTTKVTKPMDLSISFQTEKKAEIENVTGVDNGLYIEIKGHSGELPAPATVKTYVGDKYKNGEIIYLYYYNEDTQKVENVGNGPLKVEGGYVSYTLTHCSIYFLSENTPDVYGLEEVVPETPDTEAGPCEHDLVHVEAVTATHDTEGNIEHWYCTKCEIFWQNEALTEVTNSKRVITPARGCADSLVYYEAIEAGCHNMGNMEYWYCEVCDTYYADKDAEVITNSLSVILPATGEGLEYIAGVEPGCHSLGQLESWYCTECDTYFVDEEGRVSVPEISLTLPALGSENVEAFEAIEPGCHSIGQIAHWYCADCDTYYADEACTIQTNALSVILPAVGSNNVEHVMAVAPGCSSLGNTEYWYCPDCNTYFADANCAVVTNSKRIILPTTGCVNVKHVAAVAPTATKDGNSEYWYCEDCQTYYADANCTIITNVKNVVVPATGEAPKTGDNANIALFVSILGIGVVATAASIVMKKRTF
ncbi:MAG: LPXTG cell wall anchor domain-containing protein, partial [Lachnospiraceae bacterium]|nr:LPXTG cell wall anchor domain-containing protein [Lachnospiraceae bacterium]